ncbi:MAG: bifunctional diaminohydroxyphosphoribosylaminopyrimidine deaminase/5-amino-6-(5-phosphoribosylamino)uracil reductase RibD [Candidatus Delongbacteria bacterium]|nr:bifunctional diaminohydroxyphosphoribosylaminopyrimidine deaminase/5-amino-6-(5-phosphoribosylamino)uracil reductase RibD [Candidatus Delongbacteria bacterium]MCG2759928.1 bifunctional diaminohydroxyphosphoribosylaminopyrimidine deaminase/5-amino-6-(5-phosphoribosylamino)uracil reductase RibD [Candidatus Delongbacteria bacterium]
MLKEKEIYMNLALKEAIKGAGKVSPNPLVGAIIVKNGKIIGKGYHKVFGQAHAEVNAFESCIESPAGADMFVTLEPCSHFGKTPPCVDRIISEKIKRVYVGTADPSIQSGRKGVEILKNAGVEIGIGICEEKCRLINSSFFHFTETKTPYIVLKTASSLDGSIATDNNDSKWITNNKSRKFVHRLRNLYDAVLVGKNTVLFDDPELTVRSINGRNPARIIVDRNLSLPLKKKVFDKSAETIVITSKNIEKLQETIYKDNCITLVKVEEKEGLLDIKTAFAKIGETGITSIMVEGGCGIDSYLLKNRLVNRLHIFFAPMLIGSSKKYFSGSGIKSIADCIRLDVISVKRFGDDIFIDAHARYIS